MEGTALLRRVTWRPATVVETAVDTPRVKSIVFDVPDWPGHRAGQHVDVRLTSEDGYHAVRSYSIASPPEQPQLVLTVEDLAEGEVSPYLVEEVRAGDRIEIRGPVGGYFVWDVGMGGPLFLVAGGSGIVPLMAMLRHRALAGSDVPARLLYSSRSSTDVIYDAELDRLAAESASLQVIHTFTRAAPPGWNGYRRRADSTMLSELAWPAEDNPLAYVCGPTEFVETVANDLLALGYPMERIRTERFGPTGA